MSSYNYPQPMQSGDHIAIVTLAAPEAHDNPDRVCNGVKRLASYGLSAEFLPSALDKRCSYLAADPELLAASLNKAFLDKRFSGIICSGGGRNANRLLPLLDYDLIAHNPKRLIGMSNVSVVLNALLAKANLVTFHGPVLVWNIGDPEGMTTMTENSFKQWLFDAEMQTPPLLERTRFLREGYCEGHLVGGNLWSIQSLLGTPFSPCWDGAVLFWEDIAKDANQIDAMLTHFHLTGVFERIAGMVVGELAACNNDPDYPVEKMILDITKPYGFPILWNMPLGHTADKVTLPIGAKAVLDSSTNSFTLSNQSWRQK